MLQLIPALPLLLGLVQPGATDAGADRGTALLPALRVHLVAARYAPSEQALRWTGWIGAGIDLFRVRGTTGYFDADVETIIGDEFRAFDANQANYHLEPGFARSWGSVRLMAYFHHVSRHRADRAKREAVDWNLVGVRGILPLPAGMRLTLGLAHTTLTSFVDYRWELTGRVEADLPSPAWGRFYLDGRARVVTTVRRAPFDRSGFVDGSVEGGLRFQREGRTMDVFVAYEHRNDVFVDEPGVRDRALLGLRFGASSSP